MTAACLIAIGIIYMGCAIAWFILGGSVVSRSGESDQRIATEVARLWGGRHNQIAPTAWLEVPRTVVEELPPIVAGGPARREEKTIVDRTPAPASSSRVDVGEVCDANGRRQFFVNSLGLGLSGEIALEARSIRRFRGVMKYGLATLKAIARRRRILNTVIMLDDMRDSFRTMCLFVALGHREGGGFVVAPQAKLNDGWFACLSVSKPEIFFRIESPCSEYQNRNL